MEKEMKKIHYYSDVLKRFRKHKLAMIGLCVLLLEIILVVALPLVFKLDPYASDSSVRALSGPVSGHILGTDKVGRDNLARLVYGGRVSLSVGILSALMSLVIGTPLGIVAGYYRGWAETIIMRLCEIIMSFPSMVLILVLAAVFGPSISTIILVLGFLGWPMFCKLLYANVLSYKEKEYVEAARAIGTKNFTIMLKYIFPNSFSPVLIAFTFRVARAILQESTLSFLGLGVQAPAASWGNIICMAQSITVLSSMPWIWLAPSLALVITIVSINFFGDGLRDAFDPQTRI